MRLNKTRFSKAIRSGLLGLAALASLFGGIGSGVARADSPGIPNPYRADPLDSTSIRILWINTASEGDGSSVHYNVRYRLQSSKPDVFSSYTYIGGGGPPNDLTLNVGNPNDPQNPDYMSIPYKEGGAYNASGLKPSTQYCFSLRSFTYYVDLINQFDSNIQPTFSPWSGDVCATTLAAPAPVPAPVNAGPIVASTHITESDEAARFLTGTQASPPTQPDLEAVQIAGPSSVSDSVNAVYTATVRNNGSAATGNVEVVVGMSGALQAWDPIVQNIGLACTQGSGKDANTFTCEGGTLAAGQSTTLQFRAHAATPGQGTIVVSLNSSRALDESNYSNNLAVDTVTVTN
jgi:hypothetical protein